ncbi:LOW QUALITY PROTEIN: uncharacterized protein C2orf50 homolog [Pristis pectinata]|uniref:LOW QUALITY PROTEIN: uncharacterized protein C2orf50 homolog n=1 Tax=Pristis pectinata TaxID=685728 RepID=UPI00223D6F15|nr:LOW QUALITY PROTEIN: uncharacterized protein C2orf50 homolog [Pristis pectinata]
MADFNRTTSAGYRLADTPTVGALAPHNKAGGSVRLAPAKAGQLEDLDVVRNDRVWREFVRAERQGVLQWCLARQLSRRKENKWNFLKDYDAKGALKIHEPLPEYVPVFSDKIPNTTNRTFGSRMDSHLGQALIRMDYQLQGDNRKKKLDNELVPY